MKETLEELLIICCGSNLWPSHISALGFHQVPLRPYTAPSTCPYTAQIWLIEAEKRNLKSWTSVGLLDSK